MLQVRSLLLLGAGAAFASPSGPCVAPGNCTQPSLPYSKLVAGPSPGQQWNINGGFCGAFSTQQCTLSRGAWVSQDLVRKSNKDQTGIEHNMHGNRAEGYEVMPTNLGYTAEHLKLSYDLWDSSQSPPQADAYKAWLKSHLSKGNCVVWMPMCKGDPHECYPGSCPNGGHIDHVEYIYGIWSNHPLTDATVYPDDVVLHASDQDFQKYYRPMSTLQDDTKMMGNCKNAQAGVGRNEMYPCFDEQVTYGLAVTGLAVQGSLPISLRVNTNEEPDVRIGGKPIPLTGTVTISDVQVGSKYTLYRFNSTASLPSQPPFAPTAEYSVDFTASTNPFVWKDPTTFLSSSSVYYLAEAAK